MNDIFQDFPLTDEQGKRYRKIGHGCREYAPSLVTTAGEFQVGAVIYKDIQEEPAKQRKDCPFSSGLYPLCTEDCTFFVGEKCRPGTAQAAKRCPFPAHLICGDRCELYDNGRCTLFAAERNE